LHWAIENCHSAVVQTMIDDNVAVDVYDAFRHDKYGCDDYDSEDDPEDEDALDKERKTPLHLATEHSYNETARLLINAKANVESRTSASLTALCIAVEKRNALLVRKSANIRRRGITDFFPTTDIFQNDFHTREYRYWEL